MLKSLAAITAVCLSIVGSGPASAGDDKYVPSKTELRQMLEKLYELMPEFHQPETRIGPYTKNAIRAYLARMRLPQADYFTEEQFRAFMSLDPLRFNPQWTSVAASVDGKYVVVSGKRLRAEARREVTAACKKKSRIPTKCWAVDIIKRGKITQWATIMRCAKTERVPDGKWLHYTTHFGIDNTKAGSAEAALAHAKSHFRYSLKHCKTLITIAADGSS